MCDGKEPTPVPTGLPIPPPAIEEQRRLDEERQKQQFEEEKVKFAQRTAEEEQGKQRTVRHEERRKAEKEFHKHYYVTDAVPEDPVRLAIEDGIPDLVRNDRSMDQLVNIGDVE